MVAQALERFGDAMTLQGILHHLHALWQLNLHCVLCCSCLCVCICLCQPGAYVVKMCHLVRAAAAPPSWYLRICCSRAADGPALHGKGRHLLPGSAAARADHPRNSCARADAVSTGKICVICAFASIRLCDVSFVMPRLSAAKRMDIT